MNGLYNQRHAYMLRIAVPYGLLSTRQLRRLAHITRRYDKGYGHFTTRQNLQLNWPRLEDAPDILAELADVEMHAIQTSGNCVHNITCDHFAGIAPDELEDPRPYCEIMRQWSTFHPEFSYLPRKFKVAFSAAKKDRAAIAFHDIGYRLLKNDAGETGFEVIVGGGQGRTPHIGKTINPFVPWRDLLTYSESILRVYNEFGDRERTFKARIKILVNKLGIDEFRRLVEADFAATNRPELQITDAELARVKAHFTTPAYNPDAPAADAALTATRANDKAFDTWLRYNVAPHKVPGYHAVILSLKAPNVAPGDLTDKQMEAVADLADKFAFGEVRVLHTQNLMFADVESAHLHTVWKALTALDLATPNVDTLTDLICCPGIDYCALANAGSISVAHEIADTFDDYDYIHDLGELKLKMSGCINACGHHHIAHIGILGIDKHGDEWYQILLGGSESNDASLGDFIGPAFSRAEVVPAVKRLLDLYLEKRLDGERFLDTYRRIGLEPFKERAYAHHS